MATTVPDNILNDETSSTNNNDRNKPRKEHKNNRAPKRKLVTNLNDPTKKR